jgi:ABC-2 type transport system permease protein
MLGAIGVGAFTWLGAASGHAGLSVSSLLDAGINIAPPALFVLGVGVLVIGVWPRATSIATYAVIVWSALVTLIGGFSNNNHWVLDTSLFHQMAPAPAAAPNWTAGGAMIAIGAAAALVGGAAFRRRDLVGE